MRLFRRSAHRDPVERAYQAWEVGDWRQAGELLEAAVRRAPDTADSKSLWFDAALAYKLLRDWPKAYELGRQAADRAPRGRQDPAFWNLGIAATALRDWSTARECWDGYGIPLPSGTGEIFADLGLTCVRIDTPSGREVVWARRLCPVRARIVTGPFDFGRRFGEVVLHDGAPQGERFVDGRRYPVFDEIMLFTPSDVATMLVTVSASTTDDVEALLDLFDGDEVGAELLSSRQPLCTCCSEGSQVLERAVSAGSQTVLLAADQGRAAELLDVWRSGRPDDRAWHGLHTAS